MFTDDQRRELLASFIGDIIGLAQMDAQANGQSAAQAEGFVTSMLGDVLDSVLEKQRQRLLTALEQNRERIAAFTEEPE